MQNCLLQSPAPLIDVGVNLVDHSFEKVGMAHSSAKTALYQKLGNQLGNWLLVVVISGHL